MRGNTKKIIYLLILCLAIFLIFLYFENFKLENIIIEGSEHYTAEEIEEMLVKSQKDKFTHIFYLEYAVFGSPGDIPFIEKMDFEIVDKNTIHVQVYDKMIAGCVEHMGMYMHFDREGTVTECTEQPDTGVPVVTGMQFYKVVIGQKMEVDDPAIFKVIAEITQNLQKNGINCDRINFDVRQNVKLYIGKNEVLLGNVEHHDKQIDLLKKLLEASSKSGKNKAYRFDLRKNYDNIGDVPSKELDTRDENEDLNQDENTPETGENEQNEEKNDKNEQDL